MPISHKIRQHRALLGFALPGEAPQSAEWGQGSRAQAGNMAGFYAPNSGWLFMGAREWSPGTQRQSTIGGALVLRLPSLPGCSPAANLSHPTHPDIEERKNGNFQPFYH